MNYTIDGIKTWLKENLDEERYEHSLGVAECAEEMAPKFGLNKEKCFLAGLIHDCAKSLPKEQCLSLFNENLSGMPELVCGEIENSKTYHAPIGAYYAQIIFGIQDNEVLSAIRWHTIGKLSMSDFEKVIYLADKIEKRTRPDSYAKPIREALNLQGLDYAMLISYKNTIKSLLDRDLTICTVTIDIYNDLLKSCRRK